MTTATETQNWFILRGDNKYGPYDYQTMIVLIQKNELYDYNYVWSDHLDGWSLLGELPEFSRDRFARIIENNLPMKKAFIERKGERVETSIPVYGHDERTFFDGFVVSLSVSGALVLLNNPLLNPGEEITLHFRGGTPFNLKAEIIRKNFNRKRINVKSGLHYAVRFLPLNDLATKELQKIIQNSNKQGGQ